jgi:tellurite resistance protein
MTTSTSRITPNLFGIAFGIVGLAEVWATFADLYGTSRVASDLLFVLAAAVWFTTLVLYLRDLTVARRWRTELLDPVFAPFVALVGIVPMLLGVTLAEHAHLAGVVVTTISMVFTLVLGGALIGQWIVSDLSLAQWHPGYFLPTVAGGYLGADALAALGHHQLAQVLFGYGSVSWLVLGSILLQRTFVEQRLPDALLPTMAIQMAPPVVAGTAWFQINGGVVDGLALGLAGYAVLMGMVQVRLLPVFRRAPFGPGWWAFSFSYAAVFVDALHWLVAEDVAHGDWWAWFFLVVVTTALAALAVRTVAALAHGRFLPAPAPQLSSVAVTHQPIDTKEHVA